MAGDQISNQLMVHGKKGKGRKIFSQSINLFNYELQKTFLKEESSPALAAWDTPLTLVTRSTGQGGRLLQLPVHKLYPLGGADPVPDPPRGYRPPYPLEGSKEAESSELPSSPLGELPSTFGLRVRGFRKVGIPLTPDPMRGTGLTGAEPIATATPCGFGVRVKSNPLVFVNQIKPYRDGESSFSPFSPFLPKGIAWQKGEHPDRVRRSIPPVSFSSPNPRGVDGSSPRRGYQGVRVRARVGTPKGVQLPSTLRSYPFRGSGRHQPPMVAKHELPSTPNPQGVQVAEYELPSTPLGLGSGVSSISPNPRGGDKANEGACANPSGVRPVLTLARFTLYGVSTLTPKGYRKARPPQPKVLTGARPNQPKGYAKQSLRPNPVPFRVQGKGENKEKLQLLEKLSHCVQKAVENCRPTLEVRNKKVGGSTRQIPALVPQKRGERISLQWILSSAEKRKRGLKKQFSSCFSDELIESFYRRGEAKMRRDSLHKLAEGNRSYLRYRWW